MFSDMVPLRTSLMYDMPCYYCGLPMKAQEVYATGVRIIHTGSKRSCAQKFIPPSISSPVEKTMKWPPAIPVVERPKRKVGRPKGQVA